MSIKGRAEPLGEVPRQNTAIYERRKESRIKARRLVPPRRMTPARTAGRCDAFARATGTGDATTIAAADVAFHDIIVEATGNRRLVQLINNLSEQMYRYRFEYIKDESGHDNLVNEHRMIYESIIRQDKGKAAEAAKLHIDNQEKSVIRQIRLEQEHAAKKRRV